MKVQTQEKPPLLRSDVGNQETTVQSPIAQLDRYLLILRWGIIFSIGITTFFTGFEGREIIPPLPVLVAVTAFNGLLSFFLWKWRVIARGHGGRIILLDIVQATIAVALTGGYRSAFFLLFLLPIIEAAFTYHWRMAIGIIITIDVLHLLSDAAILSQEWQAYAAYIMVVKFILLLTIGAVVTFFDYLILSEYQARKKAAKTASQVKVLNDIFFRLGESHLHLDKTLNIILESTRVLPDFGLALILLPLEGDTQCRIAASTSPHCSPGEQVNVPARWISEPSVLLSVKHQSDPLPDFILRDDLTRLATARMVSITGEYEGLVIVGRRAESPLDQEERTFLQSLAQEAGLALRNARLYIQEQEQIKKLQQFENLRATFFSAIGHELKTPLTVIKMLVPSLHQFSKLPQETQTEISETIENNLMRLEHLISDLLDSARVEAGAIEIYPHSIHLLHHLQDILDNLAPLMEKKNLTARITSQRSIPPVWAEARHLDQILSNLVNNAIKFSPANSVIEIELHKLGDYAQVCVSDRGPGVPAEQKERIFDKFFVGVEHEALAGVGLGLFISRELVRLHGGKIWVEDNPAGGSRFYFTIPLATQEAIDEKSNE